MIVSTNHFGVVLKGSLEDRMPTRSSQDSRSDSGASLGQILFGLIRHPYQRLIRRWNWKSALLSSLVRGAIFFAVNLTVGWEAATAAFLTEFVFRATTAGFYGALTQQFSRAQPAWQGMVGAVILLPVFQHSLEFAAHWARGTEALAASILASIGFTALSTSFHCFVMRRGLLCVGEGSQPLHRDLAKMPYAVALFVASPFVALWRAGKDAFAALNSGGPQISN